MIIKVNNSEDLTGKCRLSANKQGHVYIEVEHIMIIDSYGTEVKTWRAARLGDISELNTNRIEEGAK